MITVLKAAGLYFLALFGAAFLLGTVRVLLVAPQIGARGAELIEMPFLLAVMIVAARGIVRRLALPPRPRVRLGMGAIALVLALIAGSFRTLDPVSSGVYYALLALYALLPLLMQSERWYSVHATAAGGIALALLFAGFAYAGFLGDLELAQRRVADASPQAQADAHACLLDALKIERAAVLGVSAGAPSSMQFVLRHPERASALVLLVPLAFAPAPAAPPAKPSVAARFMFERAVRSDFLYWLAMRLAPGTVVRTILATPPSVVDEASDDERARVYRTMEHILPLSQRQAGLLNDSAIAQSLPRYDVERIAAPTLVISMADDLYGTFEGAGYTAAGIRGARFIGFIAGGHLWVGHHRHILDELGAFLSAGADA